MKSNGLTQSFNGERKKGDERGPNEGCKTIWEASASKKLKKERNIIGSPLRPHTQGGIPILRAQQRTCTYHTESAQSRDHHHHRLLWARGKGPTGYGLINGVWAVPGFSFTHTHTSRPS